MMSTMIGLNILDIIQYIFEYINTFTSERHFVFKNALNLTHDFCIIILTRKSVNIC